MSLRVSLVCVRARVCVCTRENDIYDDQGNEDLNSHRTYGFSLLLLLFLGALPPALEILKNTREFLTTQRPSDRPTDRDIAERERLKKLDHGDCEGGGVDFGHGVRYLSSVGHGNE